MALQFLEAADLESQILIQLLTEKNAANYQPVIDSLEAQNIALIKSKLTGRYDVDAIFEAEAADRHWLIIKILVKLTVYDFVRRNAARKVPEDYVKEWEWAMKMLELIKAGKETPEGLPVPQDEDGNDVGRIIYGHSRNDDYYI